MVRCMYNLKRSRNFLSFRGDGSAPSYNPLSTSEVERKFELLEKFIIV